MSDILSLGLILASQSLPLVAEQKRKALPLPVLPRLLTTTMCSTFKSGTFLSSVSASITLSPQYQVHILVCSSDNFTTNQADTVVYQPSTPLVQTLHSMSSSFLTISIASISRLTANVLELLIASPSSSHLNEGMEAISQTLDALRELAKQVAHDWIACPLASFTDRYTIYLSRQLPPFTMCYFSPRLKGNHKVDMGDAQNTAILQYHARRSGPLGVYLSSSRLITNNPILACTSNTAHSISSFLYHFRIWRCHHNYSRV